MAGKGLSRRRSGAVKTGPESAGKSKQVTPHLTVQFTPAEELDGTQREVWLHGD